MARGKPNRIANSCLLVLLAAGFVYAGLATARGYADIFARPPARGEGATIDPYLAPVGLRSIGELREAVAGAGWTRDGDILIVAQASALSREDIVQIHFSVGYALYPARVSLAAWCDPAASKEQCNALQSADSTVTESAAVDAARRGAQRVIFVGRSNPFPSAATRRVSDLLAMVDLS